MHIQRFIDKIAVAESKQSKDFVMPLAEARGLRDELMKILAEYYEWRGTRAPAEEPEIKIVMRGGSFK